MSDLENFKEELKLLVRSVLLSGIVSTEERILGALRAALELDLPEETQLRLSLAAVLLIERSASAKGRLLESIRLLREVDWTLRGDAALGETALSLFLLNNVSEGEARSYPILALWGRAKKEFADGLGNRSR